MSDKKTNADLRMLPIELSAFWRRQLQDVVARIQSARQELETATADRREILANIEALYHTNIVDEVGLMAYREPDEVPADE